MRLTTLFAAVLGLSMMTTAPHAAEEVPSLVPQVESGELPPVAERIPSEPRVIDVAGSGRSPGQYGGSVRTLMATSQDIRMMNVYGYARLVGYDKNFDLQPDILRAIEVDDERVFTLHLRKGHKWSDGAPFTSEDFRYFWEDVASNEDLSPFGPEKTLILNGELPQVTYPDEWTVQYKWSAPNPYFLPALAGARPLYIYLPAHYMKQFHASYADPDKLAEMVSDAAVRNWASLHTRMARQYRSSNVDLPALQPWINTTQPFLPPGRRDG